ncbi:MAG: 50S ribosomal protein L23, partial [Candidatus Diapherotrites archaeon]|nr:50S ribosomal protein L23 [Candidatus Diapherotrites archaeon]
DIILYPLISEKTTNMIEAENKLCFVVDDKANKAKIKEAVERVYNVKVTKVNVIRDRKGKKRAIVKLSKEHNASELASKLGIV